MQSVKLCFFLQVQVNKPICRDIRGMMGKLINQESVVKDIKINLDQEKTDGKKNIFWGCNCDESPLCLLPPVCVLRCPQDIGHHSLHLPARQICALR